MIYSIGHLPQLGATGMGNAYVAPAYGTLANLASGLIGRYGASAAGYGYGGPPALALASQSAGLGGYLGVGSFSAAASGYRGVYGAPANLQYQYQASAAAQLQLHGQAAQYQGNYPPRLPAVPPRVVLNLDVRRPHRGAGSQLQEQAAVGRPASAPSVPPARIPAQKVPLVADDWSAASQVVASRLSGNPNSQAAISFGGRNPRDNSDGRAAERMAVWHVFQQDDSLRYDVDNGRFFRLYSDGSRQDVMSVAQAAQAVASAGDNNGAAVTNIRNLLGSLPSDQAALNTPPPIGKTHYPRVPEITSDPNSWRAGSDIVKSRLLGNADLQSKIHFNGQDPYTSDTFRDERVTVWSAMQQNDRVRYNVDTQRFFVTNEDGTTRDVANLSDVMAQQRAGQALGSQLSNAINAATSRPAPARPAPGEVTFGSANQTTSSGATLVSPTVSNDLPTFGSLGPQQANPAAAQAAFDQLVASDPNSLSNEDFLNQIGQIRQALGPSRVGGAAPVSGPGQPGPFTVVAHRYFNSDRQEYVDVSDVLIHEKGNFNNRTRNYNPAGFIDFEATKPDAETGKYYQVTVTWADGQTRVWDYRMDQPGTRVDVYSPFT